MLTTKLLQVKINKIFHLKKTSFLCLGRRCCDWFDSSYFGAIVCDWLLASADFMNWINGRLIDWINKNDKIWPCGKANWGRWNIILYCHLRIRAQNDWSCVNGLGLRLKLDYHFLLGTELNFEPIYICENFYICGEKIFFRKN